MRQQHGSCILQTPKAPEVVCCEMHSAPIWHALSAPPLVTKEVVKDIAMFKEYVGWCSYCHECMYSF